MSEIDAQAVIDAALRSAEPTIIGDSSLAAFVVPADGRLEVVDLEKRLESYQPTPRRKAGEFRVHDAASFLAYLSKHGADETEVWADAQAARIVAVLNAHTLSRTAGWADHRLVYSVQHTDAWKAWALHDGKLLDQSTFAEHIEARALDIMRPTAAEMLELAQTFQATIGVRFESTKLLSSGERQFEYRETVDAKAGRAGKLDVPKDFELALTPFEGADRFKVTARFRYRISDGALRIGYRLDRPSDVLREAFLSVVEAIESGTEHPVFRGVSA